MSNDLDIINRIIKEHQTLRTHLKLVGDSFTDREAMGSLEKVRGDWAPGQMEALTEKQNRLIRTISALVEGLTTHFSFEEKYLPSLLGELIMRALLLNHRQIRKEIDEAKASAASVKQEGLSPGEFLAQESQMRERIDSVLLLVREHLNHEEVVLQMTQRALEDKEAKG